MSLALGIALCVGATTLIGLTHETSSRDSSLNPLARSASRDHIRDHTRGCRQGLVVGDDHTCETCQRGASRYDPPALPTEAGAAGATQESSAESTAANTALL